MHVTFLTLKLFSVISPSWYLLSRPNNTSSLLHLFSRVFPPSLFLKTHCSVILSSPYSLALSAYLLCSVLPSSSPPISIPWRFFLLTLPIHSPSFVLFSLFSYDLCSSPQFLSPAISIPMLLGSLTLLCCYFSYIYVSPTPFSFP